MVRLHVPEQVPLRVQANGLSFAALEWGQGPLVLALHGFPDTAHTWDRIGPALAARGYRVVAPFMRGYAPTEIPTADPSSRTLGEDALGLIAALGADSAIVIGHDWGAESAYAAAGLEPRRIRKMITVAIPQRARLRPSLSLAWALRHFIGLQLPGAMNRFQVNDFQGVERLCRRWSPTWRLTPEELEPTKNAFAAPGCLHAALGYYRAQRPGLPEFLRAPVEVPTLSIAGADDPGVSVAAFESVRPHFRADYEVVAVPGGHFCHRESPEACIAAILGFLGEPLPIERPAPRSG